ncbi:MAG: type II toxin-antitoxin system PemK/MazF family toxin [Faecalibacterium prausnitzii]
MATRGKKEKEYPPMPANWMYKRGDVYMMDLNPYSGSEQGGIRPAIVVQNDDGNFYSNVLLVVPLTTQIKKRNMPTHFILHNRFLSAPSMAICESPRPADKSRVLEFPVVHFELGNICDPFPIRLVCLEMPFQQVWSYFSNFAFVRTVLPFCTNLTD